MPPPVPSSAGSSWRFAVVALATAAGVAATCSLGAWQLRRAAGKELLQQQIDAAAAAPPIDLQSVPSNDPAALVHRHLRVEGTWRPDQVVYLDNRPQNGLAGFYVLMALHVERPVATDLVVNRGWLPRDAADRTRIAPFTTPRGPVDVIGVALAEEPRLLELASPGARPLATIWQNFDFDAFARASGTTPLRLVLRQDASGVAIGAATNDGLVRDWPDRGGALQSQIDRHHGYAFQWFALAATIAGLFLYRVYRAFRIVRPRRTIALESES